MVLYLHLFPATLQSWEVRHSIKNGITVIPHPCLTRPHLFRLSAVPYIRQVAHSLQACHTVIRLTARRCNPNTTHRCLTMALSWRWQLALQRSSPQYSNLRQLRLQGPPRLGIFSRLTLIDDQQVSQL